jgi:hypothetical protein
MMTQWKLVPVEPTPEMIKAGAYELYTPCEEGWEPPASDVYCAMLAAAPAPDGAIINDGTKFDVQPVNYPIQSDGRMTVDPITGNVSIGTPAADVQDLVAALMIIAGKQRCVDSLMFNVDIALEALKKWEGK